MRKKQLAEYAAWYFGWVFTPVSFLRALRAPKKRTSENVLVLTSQDDFHETPRTREKGKMLNEGLEAKRLSASTVSTKLSQALKTFRHPKHGVVSERIKRDRAIPSTCKKKKLITLGTNGPLAKPQNFAMNWSTDNRCQHPRLA